VKDPYILSRDGTHDMLFSTFLSSAGPAPTYLATSEDGATFTLRGEALGVGRPGSWDAYQARLGAVLPLQNGLLGFYDGAANRDEDTHERTGLVWSAGDLRSWQRLTPDGPALVSPFGRGCLRYVDAILVGGDVLFYYEMEMPTGEHALMYIRVPISSVEAIVRRLRGFQRR
jgi:hypothetical protein